MFYFLQIKDEKGNIVVEHVANESCDSVYVDNASYYGMPYQEWRKSHQLETWVKFHKPMWTVVSERIPYDKLTSLLNSTVKA